jgi:hypothetical protein
MKIDLFKDMMRFPLSFLVLLLVCATSNAQTINAQYLFSNYTTTPSSVKQITLTPLRPNGNYTGPILIPSQIVRVTSTNGAYTYSNVVTGYRYSIDLFDGVNHYTFTNNFPLGLTNTTSGYVNAASYLGIQTGDYFAYFTATNFSITTNYFNVTNSFVITNNISGTNFSVDITTNATIATNGNTYIISVPNQSFLTNGLASLAQLQATNNILASTKLQANVFWTNMLGTGAWTNSLVAGTNATISTNLSGLVTLNVPTPSFLTNGFTDKTVTNGLATTNFVTNAISSAINVATNGLVTAAVTNGLSTTNYVNTSTNTIGIPSGLMAFQLTNVWATYNALTNYITITSNGITAGTGISAATATNIVKANAWILGGNTNSGFFGTLSNQTLNVGANSMTGLVITAFVDANDTNFYFNFGSKNTLTNFYNSAILSGEGNYLASPFFGFYPFPVGGYAGLIGGGYYNTNQGEDFAVILMGYKNAITADPYTLIGNGSSNSVGSDYASILNGYGNTIVINPSGVLDFGETILNGGNNFLQSAYSWIGGGIGNTIIYNTAGVSSPDYNAIINGTGNSITNSKNSTIASGVGNSIKSANGSFIFGSSATINSNNVAILNDGSVTSSKTNSQMILVFTNGVSINTNYANGYALFVNGSINATNMYVNGVAVATTSSAGSVGGLTNITVATNGTVYTVAVPTQAFLTNGFTTMVYSNPANMATVAYVNTVGLGATNLSYLVGQGNTNFSYLIGQAGTNLFNQAGVNLTNISSTISNNLLNFVQITNGTAFYPTLKSNITLGVFPWLTTSTNVLGINSAGVVPANGTYLQIATGTWTNVIGNGSDVIYQNPTYFLRTNLVNLYSTSNLFFNSTWLNVIGSSSVPTNSGFGYIANHNGQWDTNIWAQSLIGIVPMNSLDTTKVVTNNSSPNFNNTAVGNLTVNGFQTNLSAAFFQGNITGGNFFGNGAGLTNLTVTSYVQGSLTNDSEILLYTNNLAFIPGFGYTNWPSSTTAGFQEIANMYAYPAIRNTMGGFSVKLASVANSNRPAFYTMTACAKITNFFTIHGNGPWASVIEYKGAGSGNSNSLPPTPLMFFTPGLSYSGATNALNCFIFRDLSLISDVDTNAALVVSSANYCEVRNCVIGSSNILYLTNAFSTSKYDAGQVSAVAKGLIGFYFHGNGNNKLGFYDTWMMDMADGIFVDTGDWGVVDGCYFGSISTVNSGGSFSNTWATTCLAHVGSGVVINSSSGHWWINDCVGLNVNALVYSATHTVSVKNPLLETCLWFALGTMPDSEGQYIPYGSGSQIYSDVDANFQATGTQTSSLGGGFLKGLDNYDDSQYKIKDDALRDLLVLPNKAAQTGDQIGGSLGDFMSWDYQGKFAFNGNGITNLNPNAFIKSTANIPTNTATVLATSTNPTNGFVIGTAYTNPNQRTTLVGSAVLNAAVSGNALITLWYTNNGNTYNLQMQDGLGVAQSDIIPFSVPLAPNATFSFISTMGSGATGWVTNVINWKQ